MTTRRCQRPGDLQVHERGACAVLVVGAAMQTRGTFPQLYDNVDKTIYALLGKQLKELQPIWTEYYTRKIARQEVRTLPVGRAVRGCPGKAGRQHLRLRLDPSGLPEGHYAGRIRPRVRSDRDRARGRQLGCPEQAGAVAGVLGALRRREVRGPAVQQRLYHVHHTRRTGAVLHGACAQGTGHRDRAEPSRRSMPTCRSTRCRRRWAT